MNLGKIGILFMIVCSLFVITTNTSVAVDDSKTIDDPVNDVMDEMGELSDEKPNVDITEVTYTQDGKRITLTLSVKGSIENRGDISDLLGEDLDIDMVSYSFTLYTSNVTYGVDYVNEICNITFGSTVTASTNWSIAGDTLTVYFDLVEVVNETYEALDAYAWDWQGLAIFFDFATSEDVPLLVNAGVEYVGKVGENINFSGIAVYGTPPYSWDWDFGDGSDPSTEQNPIHAYTQARNYFVNLTVTDSEGKQSWDIATVSITEDGNGGPSDGNGDGTGSNILLLGVVIIIIAIIGVVAVVIILRR